MSSRSTSPATPTEPDDAYNEHPAVADVDLADWCHSFSPINTMSLPWPDGNVKPEFPLDDGMGDSAYAFHDDVSREQAFQDLNTVTLVHPTYTMDPSSTFPSPPPSKPVPPPPSRVRKRDPSASHKVISPPRESCYDLQILSPTIPISGTKSRVETQVRVQIDLAHVRSTIVDVTEYDKVGSWAWLKLPSGSATRKRSRKEGKIDTTPDDVLNLGVEVTCASPPHTRVACCSGCQNREAKRVARKIAARVRPQANDSDSDTKSGTSNHEDTSSIVTFNCPEMLAFSEGSTVLPLRITCYCRHHREKVGFLVHFTMTDSAGRLVGRGTTPPIMITDDHKSTTASSTTKLNSPVIRHVAGVQFGHDVPPSSVDGPPSSKRKLGSKLTRPRLRQKPYDIARKLDQSDMASPIDGAGYSMTDSGASPHSMSSLYSGTTAPSSPEVSDVQPSSTLSPLFGYPPSDASFSGLGINQSMTVDSSDMYVTDQSQVLDPSVPHFHLSSASYLPTTPPSPPVPTPTLDSHTIPQGPALFSFFPPPPPPVSDVLPPPRIHRLIPSSGPTYGGVEITVLGAHFHVGMPLNCVFGDVVASSTLRWSDNTLVCILPPRAVPGVVAVGIEGINGEDALPPVLFTYTDESDKALMELALQVVGLKMTGKVEDAKSVAMRIVNTAEPSQSNNASMPGTSSSFDSTTSPRSLDPRELLLSRVSEGNFEDRIVDFLTLLDIDTPATPSSTRSSAISQPTLSGQTLLHLAVMQNFQKLLTFLLNHKIDIDSRDRNGLTALHVAAVCEHRSCARLLIEAGADVEIVDALGRTAAELSPGVFEGFGHAVEDADSAIDADEEMDSTVADDEDEAGWGDVEDLDVGTQRTPKIRPRSRSKSSAKPSLEGSHMPSSDKSPEGPQDALQPMDEKQMIMSFVESIQKTFAQWHYPQGIIPNIPAIPLPQLPGMLAGQWGVLPQVPIVFPVFVPIPTWQTVFGERREVLNDGDPLDAKRDTDHALSTPTSIPAKKNWIDRMSSFKSASKEDSEPAPPPPPYTPSTSEAAAAPSHPPALSASSRPLLRRFGYGSTQVTDQEIKAYGYRPTSKQHVKLLKKQDRMLVMFWIPILILAFIYIMYTCVPSAVRAAKLVLPKDTALHL